jgi:hypothetical protein
LHALGWVVLYNNTRRLANWTSTMFQNELNYVRKLGFRGVSAPAH